MHDEDGPESHEGNDNASNDHLLLKVRLHLLKVLYTFLAVAVVAPTVSRLGGSHVEAVPEGYRRVVNVGVPDRLACRLGDVCIPQIPVPRYVNDKVDDMFHDYCPL